MNKLSILLLASLLFLFNGCNSTTSSTLSPQKHVVDTKKEYYTGGMLRSEFLMYDKTGLNGLRKNYGYNGELASTEEIQKGVNHGKQTMYDERGRVRLVKPFVHGRINGVATVYYESGSPLMTITYVNGVKDGPAIKYNEDGSIFEKKMFKHNKAIN